MYALAGRRPVVLPDDGELELRLPVEAWCLPRVFQYVQTAAGTAPLHSPPAFMFLLGAGRLCCQTMQSWSCGCLRMRGVRPGSALMASSGRSCTAGIAYECACPPIRCPPSPKPTRPRTGSPPWSAALAGMNALNRSPCRHLLSDGALVWRGARL